MTAILSPNERQKKLVSSVNLHTVRVNLIEHTGTRGCRWWFRNSISQIPGPDLRRRGGYFWLRSFRLRLLFLAGRNFDSILAEYPSMLRRTAALALVPLGSCFQQRFRNAFKGFAYVRIDRLRTLLLPPRFLGVRTFLKVLLSLIPLITIVITPPLILLVFGFVILVMVFVLFLQASLVCSTNLFEQ